MLILKMQLSWLLLLIGIINVTRALVPKPLKVEVDREWYIMSESIRYVHNQNKCFILHDAQKRLSEKLRLRQITEHVDTIPTSTVTDIHIQITETCDESNQLLWPSDTMNEKYTIDIQAGIIQVEAPQIWGILHALETVAQLVHRSEQYVPIIQKQTIIDGPLYPHRGYLIDTSRHFISMDYLYQFLEIMAMVKMNVFHWHIVDENSFPYYSYTYPELSQKGAYDPVAYIYTQNDVKRILEFCRLRGIRVVPEFDTPGHMDAWGKGRPEILTKCYSEGKPNGQLGSIDPTSGFSWELLVKLFAEIRDVFPDNHIHLGGDETNYTCWASNPDINAFMKFKGMGTDYTKLQSFYIEELVKITQIGSEIGERKSIVWQEVFDDGLRNIDDTIIHVWKTEEWKDEMKRITAAGFPVLYSAEWYLSTISNGIDWPSLYNLDLADFGGTPEQVALVRGGEAAMWTEFVDETNIISRSWPRGAAVAERLWSTGKLDENEFRPRYEKLRCRMLKRSMHAEPPNGPGYCEA